MTPERWTRIEALARRALDRPSEERADFLRTLCHGEESLHRQVEEHLRAYDLASGSGGTVLSQPCTRPPAVSDVGVGDQLGRFKIVRPVGSGGMATVFLAARDGDPGRPVALKLARQGFDTACLIRHFAAEERILGRLDHPSIARFVAGGKLDDGRPWVVTEFVDGMPLDTFCATHRLAVRERIELFCQVCDAVHYAHRQGVVHCDLKPRNVLVTAAGVPKLLDFGTALLFEGAAAKALGSRPLTPHYASPEQLRGEALTPASDVYSLGVLLYALLTGHLPYGDGALGPREMRRLLEERRPGRPSAVAGGGAGVEPAAVSDALDRLVLRALDLDPARRPASAEELAVALRG